MFVKSPSSFAKLLACGNEPIGTAAEDLATFVDISPYEYVLVTLISAELAAETGTDLTLKFVSSTVSAGTSAVTAKDSAGADLSIVLTAPAAGTGASMQIRTRGLNKFASPQITATGAAITVCYAIYGIGVRDTGEISAHWTDEAGATVTEAGSFAP